MKKSTSNDSRFNAMAKPTPAPAKAAVPAKPIASKPAAEKTPAAAVKMNPAPVAPVAPVAAKAPVAPVAAKAPVAAVAAKAPIKAIEVKAAAPKAVEPKSMEPKAVAPKSSAKSSASTTTLVATVDVGFGNQLFVRGEGAGLSWDHGIPLQNVTADKWQLSLPSNSSPLVFKFLINDQTWNLGDDYVAQPGGTVSLAPVFS